MRVKTLKDYYEDMYKMFPDVPKSDIKRILNFGWKSLYLHNSYGGDTCIKDRKFWSYIGHLKKDSLQWFEYYIKKLCIKLRVLYKRKKIKWDGYYYFALSNPQYEEYIALKNKLGRKRKHFTFKKIMLYQLLDECKLREHEKKYIFRIPYISDIKMKFFLYELTTDKAELIIEREPLKFTDILVGSNKYDVL